MAKYDISEDDKTLFREMMRSVTPLKSNKIKNARIIKEYIPQSSQQNLVKPKTIFLSDLYPEELQPETSITYKHSSIPNQRFQQLKNGMIAWQGRLDLHGLRLTDARETLCGFLLNQLDQSHNSVLIIHGKGSPGKSVIKTHVSHWLKQIPEVLAFHSATTKHGGTGALYVLLKKQDVE